MSKIGHMMILASAGSGKTHALTNRFLALLAAGAAPERIVALTFTRKAAGEFFDSILKKLAAAADDEPMAARLAAELGVPALRAADFLRMLRTVVDAMPRLNLGTLDSFFTRVVRGFPLELGLGGEFALLEGAAARQERRRALARLFTAAAPHSTGSTRSPQAGSGQAGGARREFIEAFKRATFGTEEKRLLGQLDRYLDAHAERFLNAPDSACWGNAGRIWPEGNDWLAHSTHSTGSTGSPQASSGQVAAERREAAARALHAVLPWATLGDKQRARLENFFAALPEWSPGAPLPKPMIYLVTNALKVRDALRAGHAELMLERKKVPLGPEACAALAAVVAGIGGAELARRLEMTRGIFEVLRGYDAVYHEQARRAGRLTFADITRLLLPVALSGGDGSGEGGADEGERRLMVDWRLDARLDHWLLDEFQDTSPAQWAVLRNLVDEAVQDPTGARSFFYVGDVKQAIYAWREGDARMFREIFDHYNAAAPGAIAEGRLDASWRSGPAVIAMVNRVFGDEAALRALLPEDAATRWTRDWREHTSARENLGGFAELRHAADEAGRFAETLSILRETEPQRRGLTVAVLVQKNDTAARLADYLRREGRLAATAESDLRVATDNPLTCALLALLRAAAHPGDTFAHAHLRMTPLGAALALRLGSGPAAPRQGSGQAEPSCAASAQPTSAPAADFSAELLTRRVLSELHAEGFAGTLERWLRALEPALAVDDAFSRARGRQLVALAREFDEGGRRDVAEFLALAEAHTARDTDAAGTVRVMTVHKAKGLGFDLVILPDLQGNSLDRRREGLAVHRDAARAAEWILDLPAEPFAGADPVLAAHIAGEEADAAHEALCVLYVAMTRAKRAMFVITEPSPEGSQSNNYPKLLRETLGDTWQAGDARWFEALPRNGARETEDGRQEAGDKPGALEPMAGARGAARLVARQPSGEKRVLLDGEALFATGSGAGAAFGAEVHALLAEAEWGGAAEAAQLEQAWRARGADAAAREVALACLRAPALAGVWARPASSPQAEVWRERAFEIVLDGAWITGVFDRVVVTRDAAGSTHSASSGQAGSPQAGRAVRATVFDFKTDRLRGGGAEELAEAAARHAGQMALYRRAAARLLALPEDAVAAELVFTAVRARAPAV